MTGEKRVRDKDGRAAKPPKKILIVKPSSMGDIVHSLPFLNAVKTGHPRSEIDWVVAKGLEGLLEGHPMINELIVIDKDKWKKLGRAPETILEIRTLVSELKGKGYDLVVDLQGLFRSGLIAMATRARVRVGFSEAREGGWLFYTRKVRGGEDVHAVDRYLKIAESLGCVSDRVIFPFPLMKNDQGKVLEIKAALKEYVVIVPGARWDTKIWPSERFGKIASMLPLKSVVIGGKADVDIAEKVVHSSNGNAISLAGDTNLRELIGIMRGAELVISNDSGPMHIAAGFNVPVIAIFGPTSPERTGPYGEGHVTVKSDVGCSPCFKKSCGNLKCMREISVENVYEKVLGRLKGISESASQRNGK